MPFLFPKKENVVKKVFAFILALVCVSFTVGVNAYADVGPKPSVTVYVNGVEDGREYYIALIIDVDIENYDYYDKKLETSDNVKKRIYEFLRDNGCILIEGPVDRAYCKMTGSDSAEWSYHPPQTFKILLYFPDNESFLVSGVLDKYAFDSYFTVDASGDSLTVAKNGGLKGIIVEAGGLLVRISLTVLIEIGVALWFGYRGKRELKLILIINIITQVLLNVLIAAGDYVLGVFGAMIAYIAGEIAVFIAEAAVYYVKLPRAAEPETKNGKAVGYAFVANLASFLGGGALLLLTDLLFRLTAKG